MFLDDISLWSRVSVNLQTALAAVTCLAEGLASAQCRASNTKWFVIVFVGTHRLIVLRMEEQLILFIEGINAKQGHRGAAACNEALINST
jgi:hypothetical protein